MSDNQIFISVTGNAVFDAELFQAELAIPADPVLVVDDAGPDPFDFIILQFFPRNIPAQNYGVSGGMFSTKHDDTFPPAYQTLSQTGDNYSYAYFFTDQYYRSGQVTGFDISNRAFPTDAGGWGAIPEILSQISVGVIPSTSEPRPIADFFGQSSIVISSDLWINRSRPDEDPAYIATVRGGKGNDRIEGDQGPEDLHGSDGMDFIYPIKSSLLRSGVTDQFVDTMAGGSGADFFYINAHQDASTMDVISDFGERDTIRARDSEGSTVSNLDLEFGSIVPEGDGAQLGFGEIAVSRGSNQSTLHFGTDDNPGADASVRLLGDFSSREFYNNFGAASVSGELAETFLFDDTDNVVDFNDLSAAQIEAIDENLESGNRSANANARGGNDIVTLPNTFLGYNTYFELGSHLGVEGWRFSAGAGADKVTGGSQADLIFGDPAGAEFKDTLIGGNGGDYIFGGSGDDIIDGGLGDDRLFGESGSDTFTGGSGGYDEISGGTRRGVASANEIDRIVYGKPQAAYEISIPSWVELGLGTGDYRFEVTGPLFKDRVFNDLEQFEFGGNLLDTKTFEEIAVTGQLTQAVAYTAAAIIVLGSLTPPAWIVAGALLTGTAIFNRGLKVLNSEDAGRTFFVEAWVTAAETGLGKLSVKFIRDSFGNLALPGEVLPGPADAAIASTMPFVRSLANSAYDKIFVTPSAPMSEDAQREAVVSELANTFARSIPEFSLNLMTEFEKELRASGFDPSKISTVKEQSPSLEGLEDVLSPSTIESVVPAEPGPDSIEVPLQVDKTITITNFETDDTILFLNAKFGPEALSVSYGSAILDIDFDLDSNSDATVRLTGDFTGRSFVVLADGLNSKIRISGGQFENGSPEADELLGDEADNLIDGLGGNDKIFGLRGSDTIFGGTGHDALNGGDGSDVLYGDANDDIVVGGDGGDILFGGSGDDTVEGGIGEDTLVGGAGNDTLIGNDAKDVIVVPSSENLIGTADFEGAADVLVSAADVFSFAEGDGPASNGVDIDIAQVAGVRRDFKAWHVSSDTIHLKDLNPADGDEGIDTLISVEKVAFDDGTVDVADLIVTSIAETGMLSLTHVAQTVTLQRSYDNPVAIAFVATENGPQPVNVRITEVSGNDLTLQLQEPNYLDGSHAPETVNYLVVEAGTWVLPDGTLLEAGTLATNRLSPQGFETVAFDAEFDAAPVVLSHVQSFNGADFVTTRKQGVDADGFKLTMQEEEAGNSGFHLAETLGWVAIEPGDGKAGDVSWLAGRAAGVSDAGATVGLGAGFDGGAHVVAGLSSFAGVDPAWARGNGSTSTSFDVSAEEDGSLDAETAHVPETVDFVAFDQAGVLGAHDYDIFL